MESLKQMLEIITETKKCEIALNVTADNKLRQYMFPGRRSTN